MEEWDKNTDTTYSSSAGVSTAHGHLYSTVRKHTLMACMYLSNQVSNPEVRLIFFLSLSPLTPDGIIMVTISNG